jgi:hypothetical protein
MKKNYESMAASNQSQVEMLQDKIISEFCEKAGQIARLAIQQAKDLRRSRLPSWCGSSASETKRSCL